MSDIAQNFKVIVALKSQKDLKMGTIRCAIQINDKVKFTVLPQSEGQFFDVNDLSVGQPITIMFDVQSTGHRIGDLKIQVPSTIYQEKEVELADAFTIDYKNEQDEMDRFQGRYYVIILNKGEVHVDRSPSPEKTEELAHQQMQQVHVNRVTESPTKQFIKSTGERTIERSKKDASKKLLAETKYDPKPIVSRKQSKPTQNIPQKSTATSGKKKVQDSRSLTKYNSQSQKSFDAKQAHQTPKRQQTEAINEEDNRTKTPPHPQRNQSPFSRYKGSNFDKLTPQELEAELVYWKGVISEQQSQLEQFDGNSQINDHLNADLSQSENKRKELQLLIRESVDDGIQFREEFERKVNDQVIENQKLTKKVKSQADRINELERAIEERDLRQKEKDNIIQDLDRKVRAGEELKRICSVQQEKLEQQEDKIKENTKNFQDQIKNLVNSINRLEQQYTKLLAEKAQSDANNQDLLAQIQRQQEKNADLESQIQLLKSEIDLKGSLEVSIQTLKNQNNELHIQLLDARNKSDQLQQVIEQIRKDIKEHEIQAQNNLSNYQERLQALKEVIKGQDLRNAEAEAEKNKLSKSVLLYKEQVASLQLGAQLSQEVLKQLEAFRKHNQQLMVEAAQMAATIEELVESLNATNNKILELRDQVLQQQELKDEAESKNNQLKRLILEMRERGVAYIPVKEDPVDQRLASFINSRQDADVQRQLFVREGEGVYQFGSKKIYIKVEQDKILIRSGGGYMSIEEFLNLCSQREMDGIMRGDPLAALQKNKAASRKAGEMKLVNQMKEDQYSPLKKKNTQNLD